MSPLPEYHRRTAKQCCRHPARASLVIVNFTPSRVRPSTAQQDSPHVRMAMEVRSARVPSRILEKLRQHSKQALGISPTVATSGFAGVVMMMPISDAALHSLGEEYHQKHEKVQPARWSSPERKPMPCSGVLAIISQPAECVPKLSIWPSAIATIPEVKPVITGDTQTTSVHPDAGCPR